MFVLPANRSRKPVGATTGIRKRRAQPEEALQMQVVKYLGLALDGNSMHFAVPNGGLRSATEAKRFKATGTIAGMFDLGVVCDGRLIGLELKSEKGRLTERQRDCHERLRRARVPVYVVRSIEDVEAALRAAGVPLRATLEAPIIRSMRGAVAGAGA